MDAIKSEFERQVEELNILENYIALSLRRKSIAEDLKTASELTQETSILLKKVKSGMQDEMKKLGNEYNELMRRMDRQQAIILEYTLKERQRKIEEAKAEEQKAMALLSKHNLSGILGSNIKSQPRTSQRKAVTFSINKNMQRNALTPITSNQKLKPPQLQLNSVNFSTPKLTIDDYRNSPLVTRAVNPIPFSFLEFEVQVTPQQFQTIPKYMRGRETLQDLNYFLETVVVPCFNEKYQLIHRKRSSIRNHHDLELWTLYNDQAKYLPGHHFITEGDISRKIKKEVDKKMRARLIMLRHIAILKEERVKQTVCFIWKGASF